MGPGSHLVETKARADVAELCSRSYRAFTFRCYGRVTMAEPGQADVERVTRADSAGTTEEGRARDRRTRQERAEPHGGPRRPRALRRLRRSGGRPDSGPRAR